MRFWGRSNCALFGIGSYRTEVLGLCLRHFPYPDDGNALPWDHPVKPAPQRHQRVEYTQLKASKGSTVNDPPIKPPSGARDAIEFEDALNLKAGLAHPILQLL